jgi:hypothetical protein
VNPTQYAAIAMAMAPTAIAVLIGILVNNSRLTDLRLNIDSRFGDLNRRFGDLQDNMNVRFGEVDRRFGDIDRRFTETNRRIEELDKKMDQRFDDMKSTWRAELHRVEEVLDARLKHLEEK